MFNLFSFLRSMMAPTVRDSVSEAAAAKARAVAVANDEYVRINYYKKDDFARYQTALTARVPDANGIKPYVSFDDFNTPPPTVAEWATWSPEKKALGHVDL